jgi:hypothetical protein
LSWENRAKVVHYLDLKLDPIVVPNGQHALKDETIELSQSNQWGILEQKARNCEKNISDEIE